jgi:hypothetical protein
MTVDAETLRHLYTLPPEEFVAARNALAKELRAAKDREGAALVAKLRRPAVPEWALNVVAAEQPKLIESVLDAAARVRDAQTAAVEGREGGDVRAALRDLREQGQALLAAAEKAISRSGRPSAPQMAALTGHLAEITGNESVGEQLRGGHLGSADVDAVDPFAGLAPAPKPKRQRTPAQEREPVAPVDDRAARRERERAVTVARKAKDAADAKVAKARAAVDDAAAKVDQAQARLDAAEEAHAALASLAEQAAAALADAEAALDADG